MELELCIGVREGGEGLLVLCFMGRVSILWGELWLVRCVMLGVGCVISCPVMSSYTNVLYYIVLRFLSFIVL